MTIKTYKPEQMSRQGEWTAWGLAIFSLLGLAFLGMAGFSSWIANFFVGFLFFAALSMSLGNWVDRRTQLTLTADEVAFANGLRSVRLAWADVREVRVFPGRSGDMVQVIGARAHFEFRTLGEMKYAGETRARTGFAEGGHILANILERAGLRETEHASFTRYTRP